MNTLRDALARIDEETDSGQLLASLRTVLILLESDTEISPELAQDYRHCVALLVGMGTALTNPEYPAAQVIHFVSDLMDLMRKLLVHSESCRAHRNAYGLRSDKGFVMPQVYPDEASAKVGLQQLQMMGVPQSYEIIPVRVSTTTINRPKRPTPPPIPTLVEGPKS